MYEHAKVKAEQIPEFVAKYHGDLQFKVDTNPCFIHCKKGRSKKDRDEDVLEVVKNVLNDIKSLKIS